MKINIQNRTVKKLLSVVLTVSIISTSFPLVVKAQANEKIGKKVVSSITQLVEKIDYSLQTAMKPVQITDQFYIYNEEDFDKFMTTDEYHQENYEVILKRNIDLKNKTYNQIEKFSGIFDGGGNTISNLKIEDQSIGGTSIDFGFIKILNISAEIKNFMLNNYIMIGSQNGVSSYESIGLIGTNQGNISGINITSSTIRNIDVDISYLGGLVGKNYGKINDCYTACLNMEQREESQYNVFGGFVGSNDGLITNCTTELNLIGNNGLGGFVGFNETHGKINNCIAKGRITGQGNVIGGFAAKNDGEITDCKSEGNINDQCDNIGDYVGGFTGFNLGMINRCEAALDYIAGNEYTGGFLGNNNGTINECRITNGLTKVKGDKLVGGFLGFNDKEGKIIYCYCETTKSGETEVIGNENVGGFIGLNSGKIAECEAYGDVEGEKQAGGFVGCNNGKINNCHAQGGDAKGNKCTGGFIGCNNGTINDSYATVHVFGENIVGGFAGIISEEGKIIKCNAHSYVTGDKYVGGFVGDNNGTVTDSKSQCDTDGNNYVGGFAGRDYSDTNNCIATGRVTGNGDNIGGFAGVIGYIIKICTAEGNVEGQGNYVGGFAGTIDLEANVYDSTSTGAVIGQGRCTGGFVGENAGTMGRINNCKATGNTTGNENTGGFVGGNDGHIDHSIAKGNVKGNGGVGGFVGKNNADESAATIISSTASGNITINNKLCNCLGGFVGYNGKGIIDACTAKGEVNDGGICKDNDGIGAFVGCNDVEGTINTCLSTGNATGSHINVGGFVGVNKGQINSSTGSGDAIGIDYVGGFAGINEPEGIIVDSQSNGNATGITYVGGFIGENKGIIRDSKETGDIKGQYNVGGFAGENKITGKIINCDTSGDVILLNNNIFGVIGNEKALDSKKVETFILTLITLSTGFIAGLIKAIGIEKIKSYIMNNYKSVAAGATIGAVILGIIIGAIIKQRTKRLPIPLPPNPKDKKKQYNTYNAIGGFVGKNGGRIKNCRVGGVEKQRSMLSNKDETIKVCKVKIKGTQIPIEVGGFAGQNGITGEIINCSAEVEVNVSTKSSGKAGGFVGNNNGRICGSKYIGRRVYLSTGKLYKDDCCGGFAGKNSVGGIIDFCEVGEIDVESKGNMKIVKSGTATVETTNKTKGGGVVGVAGKGSITMNCAFNVMQISKTGKKTPKSYYKKERKSKVKNCYFKAAS